jgi:streptogramin lyase
MRFRVPTAFMLVAAFLGSGTALATASGPSVTEFESGLTPGVQLWGITSGPDGNTWFTEENNNAVGRITPGGVINEFSDGFPTGNPRGIVSGPDGNLWVAQAGGNGGIARVTKDGVVDEFTVPTAGDPTDIAVGPDGNLWYVDPAANVIGRITTTGSITEFTDGLSDAAEPTSIVKGSDGRLWFTEQATGKIGAITTAGVITEYSSGLSGSDEPADIAAGPDGKLWFTLTADPGGIGRISTAGDVMQFSDGLTMNSKPLGIAAGPDGALWFTESAAPGRIGRVTTQGGITEYSSGLVVITNPWFIAPGPDGNMWFTGNNLLGRVARITLPPLVKEVAADQIGTVSARLRGRVRPNSQATSYHFEYGPTADYGMATTTTYAGSSYDLIQVFASVEGLAPATQYHYRVVAENGAGVTTGPDRVFTTDALPVEIENQPVPPPHPEHPLKPEFAKTIVAEGEDVRYKLPGGKWQDLPPGAELPVGVALDARDGSVTLETVGCQGGVQSGTFGGGVFAVQQPRAACGRVDVYLRGGSFKRCARLPRRAGARRASASAVRRVRRLWGRDSGGSFRSHGRHSHATVRGTRWLTEDRCGGTLTRVTNGAVVVRDFRRQRNILVRAGHSYLAKARARRR